MHPIPAGLHRTSYEPEMEYLLLAVLVVPDDGGAAGQPWLSTSLDHGLRTVVSCSVSIREPDFKGYEASVRDILRPVGQRRRRSVGWRAPNPLAPGRNA